MSEFLGRFQRQLVHLLLRGELTPAELQDLFSLYFKYVEVHGIGPRTSAKSVGEQITSSLEWALASERSAVVETKYDWPKTQPV